MKSINIANSYGVNIKGVHIPKYAVYGRVSEYTYYITDLHAFETSQSYFWCYLSKGDSVFCKTKIQKRSKIGHSINMWILNHVPYGTRVEYPRHNYEKNVMGILQCEPHEKRPQTTYIYGASSQRAIDGVDCTDRGVYNGWTNYR